MAKRKADGKTPGKTGTRRPPAGTETRTPPLIARDLPAQSLLDVVDSLIDTGVALDGEVVLGLADVDLIYLRLGTLLAAADRVFEPESGRRRRRRRRSAVGPRAGESRRAAGVPDAEPGAERPADRPARSLGLDVPPGSGRDLAQSARALAKPDETSRSVIRLVLTLVEFIRELLERQAVRRVEQGTLTADETERLGHALMVLAQTVRDFADQHDIDPAELNLDLGPLGRLR